MEGRGGEEAGKSQDVGGTNWGWESVEAEALLGEGRERGTSVIDAFSPGKCGLDDVYRDRDVTEQLFGVLGVLLFCTHV